MLHGTKKKRSQHQKAPIKSQKWSFQQAARQRVTKVAGLFNGETLTLQTLFNHFHKAADNKHMSQRALYKKRKGDTAGWSPLLTIQAAWTADTNSHWSNLMWFITEAAAKIRSCSNLRSSAGASLGLFHPRLSSGAEGCSVMRRNECNTPAV